MYAVILRYKRPLDEVDKHATGHREWLKQNYSAGNFLISGRHQPPVGGFILVRAIDRAKLDTILAEDPFGKNGVTDYEVIEFTPSSADDRLGFLIEK